VAANGAELAFTDQGEAQGKRVRPLAESVGSRLVIPCDVGNDAELEEVFDVLRRQWNGLDFLVHAIAFSDRNELKGRYVETSRQNFLSTLNISCYSFTDVARRGAALMKNGGTLVTLTYGGASRVMPNYNVMGVAKAALEASVRYLAADLGKENIRVNAISAGPINTLSARAISGFHGALETVRTHAPLGRNTEQAEVGDTALFLCSDLARGITGEV